MPTPTTLSLIARHVVNPKVMIAYEYGHIGTRCLRKPQVPHALNKIAHRDLIAAPLTPKVLGEAARTLALENHRRNGRRVQLTCLLTLGKHKAINMAIEMRLSQRDEIIERLLLKQKLFGSRGSPL